jgi:hypothetical protein
MKFKRKSFASTDYFFFEADFLSTAFFFAAIIDEIVLLEFPILM